MDDDALQTVVAALRDRPGMMVPSPHFAAVVAFLTGLDIASDGRLLTGFNAWLGMPSIAWWGQIERSVADRRDGPGGIGDMVHRLDDDTSDQCTAALFEALEAFLALPASRPRRAVGGR